MTRRSVLILTLLGAWFAFLVLVACNLGTSSAPPTLVPRATATPLPTIGFATLSPQELPEQANTPIPQQDAALVNVINLVDANRLMNTVQVLTNMGTRHVNSSYNTPGAGIGAARDYIRSQFEAIRSQYPQSGFALIEDTFPVDWGGVRSNASNVIGFLPGREVGGGIILVGAHYDSISFDVESGTAYAPGANNNATGVAAVIEMARVMASRSSPRSTVIFAVFSAEEIGRVGSQAFINNYLRPNNITINAMINMDIIGSQTGPDGAIADRQIRVYSPGPNESASRQLARALNLLAFNHIPDMEIIIQPNDSGDREGRYGDHLSFSDAGFAAVRFIEPLEETNRHHTDRDTLDDIQSVYLTRATQAILGVTVAMAEGPRAPRNVVLRDNGNGTRTLVWEPISEATSYLVALRYPGSIVYNQYFETTETSVTSEIFTSARLAGIAIAGRSANGLLGPLSAEYFITN